MCSSIMGGFMVSLALDWVANQLLNGATGVVLRVQMRIEADVTFKHELVDWLLYNKLLDLRQCSAPRNGHGDEVENRP
jgi:hypothetical protein